MFDRRIAIAAAILSTVAFGGAFALMGAMFSAAVEPEEFGTGAVLWFALGGLILTTGFWLAPFALNSRSRLSIGLRVPVLVLLVPPALLYGSLVVHQLKGLLGPNGMPSLPALCIGVLELLATLYLVSAIIRAEAGEQGE